MRRLAQELGVEAMTLYYHLPTGRHRERHRRLVVSEFELPPAGSEWKAAIRTTAISAHQVLLRHPWAASLVLSASGVSDARLRYMNSLLGSLRQAGFSAEMTDHAYHVLDSHIMGFTLWVVGMNLGSDEDLKALAAEFLRQLPRDPHSPEHSSAPSSRSTPDEAPCLRARPYHRRPRADP